MLPETNYFLVLKAEREEREAQKVQAAAHGEKPPGSLKSFLRDANGAMRANWFLFVYM